MALRFSGRRAFALGAGALFTASLATIATSSAAFAATTPAAPGASSSPSVLAGAVFVPAGSCAPNPYTGTCSRTVQGTPWGTDGSEVRSGASTSTSGLTAIPYGDWTTVWCYVKGQTVSGYGATNDPYWDLVVWNGKTGYVDDAWFDTRGTITAQVSPCA